MMPEHKRSAELSSLTLPAGHQHSSARVTEVASAPGVLSRAAGSAATSERAATRQQELLARGQTERCRVVRHVMHNLRSPLLSVLASSSVLADLPGTTQLSDPEVQHSIAIMKDCAMMMESIIGSMLDFEALDSNTLTLDFAPFTVEDLVAHVPTSFGDIAEKKGVTLTIAPIPAALLRRQFVGNVRRLRQCVHSGISNALKAMRGGKRLGEVTLKIACRDDGPAAGPSVLEVTVTDTGIGMAADALARFRRTQQGGKGGSGLFDGLSAGQLRGNGGTGLSLAIAQRVLHLHNGSSLELTSEGRGKGACLLLRIACEESASALDEEGSRIEQPSDEQSPRHLLLRRATLPAEGEDGAPEHGRLSPICSSALSTAELAHALSVLASSPRGTCRRAPQPSRYRHEQPGGSSTDSDDEGSLSSDGGDRPATFVVLHVDDDVFLQRVIPLRLFRPLGIKFEQADTGSKAVAMVLSREQPYDLILMDNQMPIMSGAVATAKLRALGYNGGIVGLTGDPSGCEARLEFEESGLDACVDKDSAGIDWLRATLRELLRMRDAGTLGGAPGGFSSSVASGSSGKSDSSSPPEQAPALAAALAAQAAHKNPRSSPLPSRFPRSSTAQRSGEAVRRLLAARRTASGTCRQQQQRVALSCCGLKAAACGGSGRGSLLGSVPGCPGCVPFSASAPPLSATSAATALSTSSSSVSYSSDSADGSQLGGSQGRRLGVGQAYSCARECSTSSCSRSELPPSAGGFVAGRKEDISPTIEASPDAGSPAMQNRLASKSLPFPARPAMRRRAHSSAEPFFMVAQHGRTAKVPFYGAQAQQNHTKAQPP